MAIFNFFKSKLGSDVIYYQNERGSFPADDVERLTENTKIKDWCIYITNENVAKSAIQKQKEEFAKGNIILLVSSKGTPDVVLQNLARHYKFSIIVAKRSETDLCLMAAQVLNFYLRMDKVFDKLNHCKDIEEIMHICSKELKEDIIFINGMGNTICKSPEFLPAKEKEVKSYQKKIISWSEIHNLDSKIKGNLPYYFIKIYQAENLYGILYISRKNEGTCDYEWFMKKTGAVISKLINSNYNDVKLPSKFSLIWKSLMEGKYSSSAEVRQKLANSGIETADFFRIILIQFNQSSKKVENIYSQIFPILGQIFPRSCIILYLDSIVVLNWEDKRTYKMPLDDETKIKLENILNEYNGIACMGWSSRDMLLIPPLYRFMQKSLNLNEQIQENRNNSPIVSFSYANPYIIIDFCAQYLRNTADMRDIVLLCHPAVINLYRYDKVHNTNLEQVLFLYISNCKSLEKTANDLFMHRNTVVNKMRKIKSLVDLDLDDPNIHAHLIFSHYILHYCSDIIDPNYISD